PLAMALIGHEADAVAGAGSPLLRRPQQPELGLSRLQRLAGLADHDRIRTGTAQPAAALAGGGDDGLIPRLRRRGGPTPHHGGQGEWLAPSGQILAQLHKVFSHRSPPPARSYSFTPLPSLCPGMPRAYAPVYVPGRGGVPDTSLLYLIASHTRLDRQGMSMLRTPR